MKGYKNKDGVKIRVVTDKTIIRKCREIIIKDCICDSGSVANVVVGNGYLGFMISDDVIVSVSAVMLAVRDIWDYTLGKACPSLGEIEFEQRFSVDQWVDYDGGVWNCFTIKNDRRK